jgi:hypothetical protein
MVLVDVRWDLLELQHKITGSVLASRPGDPQAAVDEFVASEATVLKRIRSLQRSVVTGASPSALAVITSRLRDLRPAAPVRRKQEARLE